MSMSTKVVGFVPPDEKWHTHKKVWDACDEAGVPVPDETLAFFDHVRPDERGVEIELPVVEYNDQRSRVGFELDVREIPENVQWIRFFNSW